MKKFNTSLKLGTLLIGMAMLSACQSTANIQQTSLAQANIEHAQAHNVRALFASDTTSPAATTKNTLINALQAHLKSERYALNTSHYKIAPSVAKDSIDASADSFTSSFIKTTQYQNQAKTVDEQPSFRSYLDYLYSDDGVSEFGELPYLRYDDEMAGRTGTTVVTRREGIMENAEYIAKLDQVNGDIINLKTQIASISSNLDDLVEDNPTINTNHADVKAELKELSLAIKHFSELDNELGYTKMGGYIAADYTHAKTCAMMFDKTIRQALAPNRHIKSYDGQAYDYYDLVYINYHHCERIYHLNKTLEPDQYLGNSTEDHLRLVSREKECSLAHFADLQSLLARNQSYQRNPEAFAQSFISRINCIDDVLKQTYPDYDATTISTLDAALDRDTEQYYRIYQPYSGYEDDEYDEYEYDDDGLVPNEKLKSLFDDFKQMKQAEFDAPMPSAGMAFGNVISMLLNEIKMTDEQILAKNIYQYDNAAVTILSHHQPQNRKMTALFSFDAYTPTSEQSVQLPISLDFTQSTAKADVSALLPLMAIAAPQHAPLPQDLPNQEMTFTLPNDLQQYLPMSAIYDATHQGIIEAMTSLNGEKFTAVDISNDAFAKQLGASRAIKINLDAKDIGQNLGMIVKHITQALKTYVDAHPDIYQGEKGELIKAKIDELALVKDGYHSKDIGGLLQIIEAIFGTQLHQSNYFYLNQQGNIIGMQAVGSFDSHLFNMNEQSIQQVRYSRTPFAHPMQDKFANSFTSTEQFDGTAWLTAIKQDSDYRKQAVEARQYYHGETAATAADAAAQAAAEAMKEYSEVSE